MPLPLELTHRERQVLGLVAEGKTDAEIGAKLFLSRETIKTHNKTVRAKLGARNRAHAVHNAHRLGILPCA